MTLLDRLRATLASRYDVEREVGQGGMSVVFLATDIRHRRRVAIKVLRPEIAAHVGGERFLREIEIVAQLQHPHILPLYDSGDEAGLLYFVMPFVEGESLRARLDRERQLPLDDALAVARDVGSALAFAHAQGIVHRDIKPENILLFGGSAVVADFGIARAVRVAGQGRVSEIGLAVGTPLYMSPEQAEGLVEVDARADVYSLGCVLYEMLSGQPPFTGPSPADVFAHHIHDTPRPIQQLRTTVPPLVSQAIGTALAKLPADRFATVAQFIEALRAPSGETAAATPRRARRWIAAGTAAATLVSLLVWRDRIAATTTDPGLYALMPVQDLRGASTAAVLTPEMVGQGLYRAFLRWHGARVVDPVRARDAWERLGRRQGLRRALEAARNAGAGLAVWCELRPAGDSVLLQAVVYDAGRSGATVRAAQASLALSAPIEAVDSTLVVLVAGLLAGAAPGGPPAAITGTTSIAALRQLADGIERLRAADLSGAESQFQGAAAADESYALAWLWLAQTRSWRADGPAVARVAARRAVALLGHLVTAHDSGHALALLALADSQFREACDRYAGLLRRDSSDVVAMYGMAECLRADDGVVRDPAGATGWRFRTSWEEAIRWYRRALGSAPSFAAPFGNQAHRRLARLLIAEQGRTRRGRAASAPDTGSFAAFPALQRDTVAYAPGRLQPILNAATRPPSVNEALARNRMLLRQIVDDWVSALPTSAEAHAGRALVQELEGLLEAPAGGGPAALVAIREARRLAPDSAAALRFALVEARLLVKVGRFTAVRLLAESLLARWAEAPRESADGLAALAALAGRVHEASARFADPGEDSVVVLGGRDLPVAAPLMREIRRFEAYAGFGAPVDSVRVAAARVESLLVRHIVPQQRAAVRAQITAFPAMVAFPAIGPAALHLPSSPNYLVAMQARLARGDRAGLRRALGELRARRRNVRPGDVAMLGTYLESLLAVALGDTARALADLDAALGGLPASRTQFLLDRPSMAALLVRAMLLRARLGPADDPASRRWGDAALALWANADPELSAALDAARRR